jgi:hypothetical protein
MAAKYEIRRKAFKTSSITCPFAGGIPASPWLLLRIQQMLNTTALKTPMLISIVLVRPDASPLSTTEGH